MAKVPKIVDEFISNKFKEYLKIYLVFKYKGYSWKKELQNEFSIADSIVNDGLKVLEKEGFLISKDYWSLDLDMQEVIRRLNGAYFNKISSFPKIYILNNDEKREQWWECNKDDIENLIRGDGSIEHTLNLIHNKNEAYKKLQFKFQQIEESRDERVRFTEDGVMFMTPTKKKKKLQKQLKKSLLEVKKDILLENKRNLQIEANKDSRAIALKGGSEVILLNEENNKENYKFIATPNFNQKLQEIEKYEKESKEYEKELTKDEKIKKGIHKIRENMDFASFYLSKLDLIQIPGYGKPLEELDDEAKSKINFWENLFEIKNNESASSSSIKFSSMKEKQQAERVAEELIEELKSNKFLDIFKARKICGNDNSFIFFQEKLKDHNVEIDGEDFIYKN